MEQSLVALVGLALVDCLNPSALAVTFYLLTGERPGVKVSIYMFGVFFSYLTFGIVLLLGLEALITKWNDVLWSPTAFAVQGVVGALMLVYSFRANPKAGSKRLERLSAATGFVALFLLGAIITVVELTTAIPYFGAIGLLTYMRLPLSQSLLLLVAYNLIFVLPPFLLLGLYSLLGTRLAERFGSLKERTQRAGREALLWIIGIVGFYLMIDAVAYFDFFGFVDVEFPQGLRSPSEALLRRFLGEPGT